MAWKDLYNHCIILRLLREAIQSELTSFHSLHRWIGQNTRQSTGTSSNGTSGRLKLADLKGSNQN